ncbi:MAG: Gfo/Idh/MocA family oxidoreductase [bacterium]|nr:Gfo/Idh/MocA family oxidoreductase [bacterium]
MPTRRAFLQSAALAAAGGNKIRIAVLGGGFGTQFQWHEHPRCEVVAATDLHAQRRTRLRDTYRCDNIYHSFEDLLRKSADKLDAVAVFSGAPDHVKHALMSFDRGLHVISAVPACMTLEDAERLRDAKEKSGLRYMMAETSYYRAGCIYSRELYRKGGFGNIFYSEVEYYHDSNRARALGDKNSLSYNPDGSVSWRQGLPPMLYPTHSLGFVVGVTGERIKAVSSLGWGDPKLAAKLRANPYDNPFSNEFASMQTTAGNMVRCNVFWQIAAGGERAQWFGEKGSFYMAKRGFHQDMWHPRYGKPGPFELPDYTASDRLPEAMRHGSGHGGSHPFLTAEFVNALVEDREPVIDVYESLAMTVPGIVAHQSSKRNGEQLKVPQFDQG